MTFCALLKGLDVSYSDFFKVTQEVSDLADEFGDELVSLMKISAHSNKNEYIKKFWILYWLLSKRLLNKKVLSGQSDVL